jgi:hypothetical protein
MKTLKVGFTDTYANAINFFMDVLGRYYNVIRDDSNPDYLIFGDPNFGQNHYNYKNCKKILFTGENYRPTYFAHDFAITFDHENSPKHYRLPLYVADILAAKYDHINDDYYYLVNKKIDVEKEWSKKTEFCSYIQSNPRCEVRNNFVDALSNYKRINCAGPHKNNIGYVLPRPLNYKLDFLAKHKFNISFENGSYPGYVTEKILNSFYGNTVPIYWGSSTVHRDFNTKAFVNCMDFSSFNEVIDRVRELDSNKNMYLDMLEQPAFTNNIPNEWMDIHSFYKWFDTFVYEEK